MTHDHTGKTVGVVGVPGGWSSEALADALAERTGGNRVLVDMARVSADLTNGRVMFGGVDLMQLDGLVMKKIGPSYSPDMLDRLELLRFVEESGVPIFSRPSRILRLLDRLSCTVTLRSAKIPMPPTTITESIHEAARAVATYGTAVFKPLYSTKARGMTLIEAGDHDRVTAEIEAYQAAGNPVMYIQQVIDLPGRDLGVVFLGGEYLGTYARVKTTDAWNTTTRSGGKYQPHAPRAETIEIATAAQAAFGLDFTCVDMVETADGPVCFEVSAFGGFRGTLEALGIDAAARYADYVLKQLARGGR